MEHTDIEIGLNQHTIVGMLGRDPVVTKTRDDRIITKISIGVANHFRKGDEQCKTTDWLRLCCFGRLAEISQGLKEGDVVMASGRVTTRSWTSDDGIKHYLTETIADKLECISSGGLTQSQKPVQTYSVAPRVKHNDFSRDEQSRRDADELSGMDIPF